jgi:hypothetical protein
MLPGPNHYQVRDVARRARWNRIMRRVMNFPGKDRGTQKGWPAFPQQNGSLVRAGNKSKWKTLMVIPLNYLNPLAGS